MYNLLSGSLWPLTFNHNHFVVIIQLYTIRLLIFIIFFQVYKWYNHFVLE